MEMPEGWKRVNLEFQSADMQFKSAYVGAKSDVIDAMDLMKEMAESLKDIESRMQVWHDLSNLKRIGEPTYQQEYLDIKNLNKKFREWK